MKTVLNKGSCNFLHYFDEIKIYINTSVCSRVYVHVYVCVCVCVVWFGLV